MRGFRLVGGAGVLLLAWAVLTSQQLLAADASSSMEARLRMLEDKEAIRDLLEHYIELNESRDYAAYSQLFAANGELVMRRGRATGPEPIRKMLEQNFGAAAPASSINSTLQGSKHVLSNIRIDVNGDNAAATSRWMLVIKGEQDQPRVSQMGHYGDKLVRENGVWKFQQRIIYRDIPGDPQPR